jgi:hypothetical protein
MTTTAPTITLHPFEGRDVATAAIEIPNAGGGLQDAMKFAPMEFHHGDEVFVVMRCVVRKVRFDPVKDSDELARVHVFHAEEATFVDGDTVREALDSQRAIIDRAKLAAEAEAGIQRIPFTEDEVALSVEHDRGDHADGLRAGCPQCGDELAAAEREARESE